jgi:hypothetical protein
VKISGEYIAHGGEQYITIGNFYTDSNTDTIEVSNYQNRHSAYYYIDDVSIIDCTEQGIEEEEWQGQCSVYPNPAKDNITIDVFGIRQHTVAYDVKIQELNIYNAFGAKVVSQYKPPQPRPGECKVNVGGLVQGVYFVEIKTAASAGSANGLVLYRKFVKQ